MNATTLMPAAFVEHGSPMNTLQSNRYTSAWQALGGAPEVARELAELVRPSFVGLDEDSCGLDHGTWLG